MAFRFNDAKQEYENNTSIYNSDITNVVEEGNTGENSTINDLITLVNDFKDLPDNEFTRFNTYVKNNNFEGEIRFFTANALNNNDYNKNLLSGEYTEPRLRFNTKIAEDGYIYCYYTYNFFDNQVKPSGWYNIIREIAQAQSSIDLQGASLIVIGGNVSVLNTTVSGIQGQVSALQVAFTASSAVQDSLVEAVDKLADFVGDRDEYFGDTLNDLTGAKGIYNGIIKEFKTGLNASKLFNYRKIAFELFGSFFDVMQIALAGLGIIATIYAIYDSQVVQQKEKDLMIYYENLRTMDKYGYDTSNTGLLVSSLSFSPNSNRGFTTNGKYQITITYSGTTPAKLYVEVYDDAVSGLKKARVLDVIEQGTGWGYGMGVSIPKSSLGGWDGVLGGANLALAVSNAGTMKQLLYEKIDASQKVIDDSRDRSRRRQLIPNKDDFGEGLEITQTTELQESGELLPKLNIKINYSTQDFFVSPSNFLNLNKVATTKFDGLVGYIAINYIAGKVSTDIRNNLYPTREIIANVWYLLGLRLQSIKDLKNYTKSMASGLLKDRFSTALEERTTSIFQENNELLNYWYLQFLKKPYDPADYVANKIDNYYFAGNFPTYVPSEFVVQNGCFFAYDTTGYEVLMFFELTDGVISNQFVCDYGNQLYTVNTQIIFSKNDLGGYTGTSPNLVMTVYSMLDSKGLYEFQRYNTIDKITDSIRRFDIYKGVLTVDVLRTMYNPSSGLVESTYSFYDRYTNTTITQKNFKIKFKSNHLAINASNELEISPNYFFVRDFWFNTTTSRIELLEEGRPYIVNPLNGSNTRSYAYGTLTCIKTPTTYPYYDSTNTARSQTSRLYLERIRAIHLIKIKYASEPVSDFNDTMEMLDAMYIDVYKEQMGILTFWLEKELNKTPADTALNKVSSFRLVDFILPASNLPASYATQNGIYIATVSGTQFLIEIFRGKCIDIKASISSSTYGSSIVTFNIPKSLLGGAVAGQSANLTFTAYYVSNTLQSIQNEMKHFKNLMYKLAVRRLRRYGGVSVFDLSYTNNPNGGLQFEYITDYEDPFTMEKTSKINVNVNLDLNDFYITPLTGEIALNLTNKIDGTLTYNTSTRKIGINTTVAQTFGNITAGTIGCGAITSTSLTTTGNVGIGISNPVYRCHIKSSYSDIATGLHIDASDNGTPNQYALTIYPYVIGGGVVGYRFRTQNGGTTNTPLTINNGGTVSIGGTLNSGDFNCNAISSTTITTNNNNVNVGNGVLVAGNVYLGQATTAGWSANAFVAGSTGTSGSNGYYIFGKNNGSGGNRYGRIGFNDAFEIVIGDAQSGVNGAWTHMLRMAYNAPANSLVMSGAGYIGCGLSPAYRLHVVSTAGNSGTGAYKYIIGTTTSTSLVYSASTSFSTICAKFDSSIWSLGLIIASSDIRIKKDIEYFDNTECLNKLLELKPCKYNYIDETKNKNKYKSYGFIAQDLEKIIPEMVQTEQDVIPNIQKQVQYDKENKVINITFEYDIIVGKKLKIFREGYAEELTVVIIEKISDYSFKIDTELESENVILYGEYVDNFLTITKESLIPVLVSGTQELNKIILEQKNKINELEEKLNKVMVYLNI